MIVQRFAAVAALVLLIGASPNPPLWLDTPKPHSWQTPALPRPPHEDPLVAQDLAPGGHCAGQIRRPAFAEDRAVIAAGWKLFGAYQSYSGTTIVLGMAAADGMCRPNDYQGFVFSNGVFVGTLAPQPTSSRTDGAIGIPDLSGATDFSVQYPRYSQQDPLCCPSRTSLVFFSIGRANGRPTLRVDSISTTKNASQ